MADQRRTGGVRHVKHPGPPPRAKRDRKNRLVLSDGRGNSRLFIALMATMMLRVDSHRRRVFGDIDLSTISDTVGLAAAEAVMRDASSRDRYRSLETVIGITNQRGINALSIAQATGIPRETVRRKLKLLVKRGFALEQAPGRYIIKPGVVQKPEHLAIYERCMHEAVRFMNECLVMGLVRLANQPGDD